MGAYESHPENSRARPGYDRTVTVIFLGTAESGKTTLINHLRVHRGVYFTQAERDACRRVILENVIGYLLNVVDLMPKFGKNARLRDGANAAMKTIRDWYSQVATLHYADDELVLPTDARYAVMAVWADSRFQKAFRALEEKCLSHSQAYLLSDLERIIAPGYFATDADILRCDRRTICTRTQGLEFHVGTSIFKISEAGGMRSMRRKWRTIFSGVCQALVYVAAMSDYDQCLEEDPSVNSLSESVEAFVATAAICPVIILILNKADQLEAKLATSPLRKSWPKFQSANTFDNAVTFITQLFLDAVKTKSVEVFPYHTCALDSGSVREVFNTAGETLLDHLRQDSA